MATYWTLQATASALGTCFTASPCLLIDAYLSFSGNASLVIHDSASATAPAPIRFAPIRVNGTAGPQWNPIEPISMLHGLSVSLSPKAAATIIVSKRTRY